MLLRPSGLTPALLGCVAYPCSIPAGVAMLFTRHGLVEGWPSLLHALVSIAIIQQLGTTTVPRPVHGDRRPPVHRSVGAKQTSSVVHAIYASEFPVETLDCVPVSFQRPSSVEGWRLCPTNQPGKPDNQALLLKRRPITAITKHPLLPNCCPSQKRVARGAMTASGRSSSSSRSPVERADPGSSLM